MSVTLRNTLSFYHYIIGFFREKTEVFCLYHYISPNLRNRHSQQLTGGTPDRYNYRLCRNAWSSTFRARSASTASPCCGR